MTFFEAYQEELENSQEADAAFPDPLKEPVLRKANFMTTPRMDKLVDEIYDAFKTDFFTGERVHVFADQEKLEGVVREKARFPETMQPNGSIERAHSRYFVSLDDRPEFEALVDDEHIGRDRHAFTKVVLKSFLKRAMNREAWIGAPWVVKSSFADKYSIDIRVPIQLTKGYAQDSTHWQKDSSRGSDRTLEHGKSAKGYKSKHAHSSAKSPRDSAAAQAARDASHGTNGGTSSHKSSGHHHSRSSKSALKSLAPARVKLPPKPPPPPPMKYPLEEDLELPPEQNHDPRPALSYLSTDLPREDSNAPRPTGQGSPLIRMETVGLLLETWETLNVFCGEFLIDSFTFDDYVGALLDWKEADEPCLLMTEIHCSLLKTLVNSEKDDGDINVDLPDAPSDSEDDQVESDSEPMEKLPSTPEPGPKSLPVRFGGFVAVNRPEPATKTETPSKKRKRHGCRQFLDDYDWLQKLRAREFHSGAWQCAVVGFLYRLTFARRQKGRRAAILRILRALVPDGEVTGPQIILQWYNTLDVNLKVAILQILCSLIINTKSLRACMETDAEAMTDMRKEKVEFQKQRKVLLDVWKATRIARYDLVAREDQLPTPVATEEDADSTASQPNGDVEMKNESLILSDDEDASSLSVRRTGDRNVARKRKRDEADQVARKKALAEAAAKEVKTAKAIAKLDKEGEKAMKDLRHCEDKIVEADEDLRQADIYRARILGKDRFWNRYYWFERNGMPYGGMPSSSTSHAKYANARIWVQGPDPLERAGYIDVEQRIASIYKSHYHMTPIERKKKEEGRTSLWTNQDWGYFDGPEQVEQLIDWLDERGRRELMLKKELKNRKEIIVEHMLYREAYLYPDRAAARKLKEGEAAAAKDKEAEETAKDSTRPTGNEDRIPDTDEEEEGDDAAGLTKVAATPNVSTRTRGRTEAPVVTEKTEEGPRKGWLDWKNSTALFDLNHYHSEEPVKRQARGKAVPKQREQQPPPPVQDFARQTRGATGAAKDGKKVPLNRQGKPLSRQG